MKKEKEINFSPADYDYMDNMPLAGWMWEFIRRSQAYNKLYSKVHDIVSIERGGKPLDSSGDHDTCYESYFELKEIGLERHYMYKSCICDEYWTNTPSVQTAPTNSHKIMDNYFIYSVSVKPKFFYGIPDPAIRFTIFKFPPIIRGMSYLTCETYDALKSIPDWDSPLSVLSPTGNPNDTIYLGITRSATISDIEKVLLPTIKKHLTQTRSKPRRRKEKWKYYLIVHDLARAKMSYAEILEELIKFYPEDKNLFDARNIENYYKNSLALIEGGYKNYMLGPK